MSNEVILDIRIYPLVIIQQGILDYQSVTEIKIVRREEWQVYCEILCLAKDYRKIRNEFCNYLIALRNIMEC